MRPYSMGSINALVKYGGAASLKDTASQADVKKKVDRRSARRPPPSSNALRLRDASRRRPTSSWSASAARSSRSSRSSAKKGVAVGRPFPPMTTHMRVSIGTADEMARFMTAFKEIFPGEGQDHGGRLAIRDWRIRDWS